ncbi:MAG: DUF4832 domain-containing protein [Clostridia bacterium]
MRRRIACLFGALCLLLAGTAQAQSVRIFYEADRETALINPYIGNAAWAREKSSLEQPFTLVYANLRWADFEPEEGQYDFAAFEEENQLDKWRGAGKHLILRFVLDLPQEKKHLDIPQWLYDQTGDGLFYRTPYGRGYSPNYENELLIAAHARAIAALGARYGSDPFVAFVELGSLGHWGEWHVHETVGTLPEANVRNRYVTPYVEAFPHAYVMARRPFAFAAEMNLGLFNDTSGDADATGDWLSWIENGGKYQSEKAALSPMPLGWIKAPIGGELASDVEMDELLGSELETTLALFRASHTSWIGPHSFVRDVEWGGEWQPALNQLLCTIGYRLRVESAVLCESPYDEGRSLTLHWQNDGVAPFYFDWLATLRLTNEAGESTLLPLDMRLCDVLPGEDFEVSALLPADVRLVELGIINPQTGGAGVQLAMHARQDLGWYTLLAIE